VSTESTAYLKQRMDETWPGFRGLVHSVPQEEMDVPGVTGDWCLKELLGHVNFWAQKGAKGVRLAAAGKPGDIELPGGQQNVDTWNAQAAARGKAMSAEAVLRDLDLSHEDARQALDETTDEALSVEVGGWTVGVRFAEDTYRHYREHGREIEAWRRALETSEA
jgi:hypothetical protein